MTIIIAGCSAKVMQSQDTEEAEERNEQTSTVRPAQPLVKVSSQNAVDEIAIQELIANGGSVGQASNRVRSTVRELEDFALTSASSVSIAAPPEVHTLSLMRPQITQDSNERFNIHAGPLVNTENYLAVIENAVKLVSESPVSTFSIDVDTAAYSNLRRMILGEGRLPPFDAVRLEEMINYFDYNYASPDSLEQPLAVHTEISPSPWNPSNRLLMVGIKGYEPAPEQRPAANLVFLVDVSGSMRSPDKLGLVKKSLRLLVDQMNDEDRIALVVYAGAAGMVLDSTAATEKTKILTAIESLVAGGSTNGAAGIELAYRIAEENKIENGINRVIIASDGDLNVGVTSIDALKEMVSSHRHNGVALSTLGFGSGNYNYSLMEQLADVGNGSAAYIDSLNEARKVLVEELQSTLLTIAKDVKIQIEFNPAVVAEYRLIGYENRLLRREDFNNDKIDAGEIGAGHTVTALYELTLVSSDGGLIPDRRYNPIQQNVSESSESDTINDELAYVKIRYKQPDSDQSTEMAIAVLVPESSLDAGSENIRFAAAVAGFGQLLRGGKYTSDWNYDELLQFARQARGSDLHGYRSEMLNLIEMAKLL